MDTYFILGTSGEQRMTTDIPQIRATVRVYEGRMLGLQRTAWNVFAVQLLKEAHVQCSCLTLE